MVKPKSMRIESCINTERFLATLDSRTTPICRALDGKVYDVGKGPKPPLHRHCRSLMILTIDGTVLSQRPANAVTKKALAGLKGEARQRKIAELVGTVPGMTTYTQFLKNQSVGFQNEVLGLHRARLFRAGKLTLEQFVDMNTGRQYTLSELRKRHPNIFK